MSGAKIRTRTIDEAAVIERLVKKRALPKSIKGVKVELGSDSTGAPAAWIYFFIDDDVSPSARKITELTKLAETVRADVLKQGFEHWPYVRFLESA